MFPENTHINFGPKTYWYLVSKKVTPGFVFLLLALALSFARGSGLLPDGVLAAARGFSWVLFIVAALALAIAFATSRLSFNSLAFMLSPDALTLRRGVWKREEYAIPYRQIQNIEIERSIGQRMLGISRLIVVTAGEHTGIDAKDAPEGVLPAIDADVADKLRHELLRRANVQKTVEVK